MNTRFTTRLGTATLALMIGTAGVAHAGPDTDDDRGFSIEGSVRVRAEVVDGQARSTAAESDAIISSRTLILARYNFGGLHVVGEIDDARGYGQDVRSSASSADINALEPIQAYLGVELGEIAGQKGKGVLRLGRFTFESGSGRLIERSDASNSPVTFLGANFDWRSARGDRVNVYLTQPFDRLPTAAAEIRDNAVELDRTGPGLRLGGASFTRARLVAGANAEVFGIWLDEKDSAGRATRDRNLFTFGGRLNRIPTKGKFDFDVDGALQHGTTRGSTSGSDVTDRRVRAGMVHAELGYTFPKGWTPRVALLLDYASGDTPEAAYHRFDALFGSRRGDFGPNGLYGPLSRSNIVSPGIAVEGKPSKAWDVSVKARKLWLASATDSFGVTGVRDASGATGRDAGAQVEGRVRYWAVPKRVRIEGGAAWLAKGDFLTNAPNAPATGDMRFGYLAVTTSF